MFCGDGDMEEGISHEACSWAGAMKLDDLILVYDANSITIEGATSLALADDVKKRFESYGWKVLECDGHDYDAIDRVYRRAMHVKGQPVLIVAKTHIGFGAPTKHDSADSHGAPLGAEETRGLKTALGFDPDKSFFVPDEVYALFGERAKTLGRMAKRWRRQHPEVAEAAVAPDYMKLMEALPRFEAGKSIATRAASGQVMNALATIVPELVGGSADLGPSNKTYLRGFGEVSPGNFAGRNIHYGIRELAMTAIANGLTAFGGFRGYGATFFVFSDYCKPALRLAALMKVPSIFVFSHDSFYVGEDGPTHEPVEHLASMRIIPGLTTYRPADANETAYAWAEMLLDVKGPSCILTTRQDVPVLEGVRHEGVSKGAYVIYQSGEQDEHTLLFIASGSEVALALDAAKALVMEGRAVRVVSMPSMELFLRQPGAYRDSVIPGSMPRRIIVEAGVRFGWDRFRVEPRTTRFVTMDNFGASAPYRDLAVQFGFTVENVIKVAKTIV
ncbi:MAG TPA: transketolase [Verrucomicrobia bacterium]|nr:transketolase [Verrucomicrobiota bacterium]